MVQGEPWNTRPVLGRVGTRSTEVVVLPLGCTVTHTHTIFVLVGQVYFKKHRLQGELSLSSGCFGAHSQAR